MAYREMEHETIKIYRFGEFTIQPQETLKIGSLPADYQGARAYLVTCDFNASNIAGGVNKDPVGSDPAYTLYCKNLNTSLALRFDIKVVCIF